MFLRHSMPDVKRTKNLYPKKHNKIIDFKQLPTARPLVGVTFHRTLARLWEDSEVNEKMWDTSQKVINEGCFILKARWRRRLPTARSEQVAICFTTFASAVLLLTSYFVTVRLEHESPASRDLNDRMQHHHHHHHQIGWRLQTSEVVENNKLQLSKVT